MPFCVESCVLSVEPSRTTTTCDFTIKTVGPSSSPLRFEMPVRTRSQSRGRSPVRRNSNCRYPIHSPLPLHQEKPVALPERRGRSRKAKKDEQPAAEAPAVEAPVEAAATSEPAAVPVVSSSSRGSETISAELAAVARTGAPLTDDLLSRAFQSTTTSAVRYRRRSSFSSASLSSSSTDAVPKSSYSNPEDLAATIQKLRVRQQALTAGTDSTTVTPLVSGESVIHFDEQYPEPSVALNVYASVIAIFILSACTFLIFFPEQSAPYAEQIRSVYAALCAFFHQ